jgi:hypothetical protein
MDGAPLDGEALARVVLLYNNVAELRQFSGGSRLLEYIIVIAGF